MKKLYLLFFITISLFLVNSANALNFWWSDNNNNSYSSSNYWDDSFDTDNFIMWLSKNITNWIFLILWFIILFNVLPNLKNIIAWKSVTQSTNLVLTKISINKDLEDIILIEWRKWGIINFILTKLNIDNKTTFKVNTKDNLISMEVSWINWNKKTFINIDKISSTTLWYNKKLLMLVFFMVVWFILLFSFTFLAIVLMAMTYYYYYTNKSSILEFESIWGNKILLWFTNSIIENVKIDNNKMKEIENIIINLKK